MRVLQINSSRTYGGGEKHVVDLCRGLLDSAVDVQIAVRPSCEWTSKIDFLDSSKIHRISLRNSADLLSSARLARIIKKNRIEIVHAHAARDYPVAAIALRQAGHARLVVTRHVMFPLKNVHKLLLRNVSAAIGVSNAAADNLRRVFPDEKVVRVYNGLDPVPLESPEEAGRAFRFEHNISYDDTVITSIGTFSQLKGQRDLITAASKILVDHADSFFVFVGKDETNDRRILRELQRHAGSLGVREHVLFRDWVNEMGPLFAASDIFVSPSHSESFGLAILEAMAYGKPVVSTATDGAKELITDRKDGLLVPVRDPAALAEALIELMDNSELAKDLAGNAASTAKESFSLEKMIKETKQVYEDVLNK